MEVEVFGGGKCTLVKGLKLTQRMPETQTLSFHDGYIKIKYSERTESESKSEIRNSSNVWQGRDMQKHAGNC